MATFLVALKSNSGLLLVKREEWSNFFRDYEIALDIMSCYMPPGPGTATTFAGGGVPKDFIQITTTSVAAQRGIGQASPHVAAIQISHPDHHRQHRLRRPGRGPASTPSASHGARKRPRD